MGILSFWLFFCVLFSAISFYVETFFRQSVCACVCAFFCKCERCLHLTRTVFPLRTPIFFSLSVDLAVVGVFFCYSIHFDGTCLVYLFVPFGIIIGFLLWEAIFMSTKHLLKHNIVMCTLGCRTVFINCNKYTTPSVFFSRLLLLSHSAVCSTHSLLCVWAFDVCFLDSGRNHFLTSA